MAVVRENIPPARHPWIDAFLASPDREFADFLAGYARIEPYGRAETPDAARMLFGPLAPENQARRTLDGTLSRWLEDHRREGVPAAEGPRLDRKLREIMDAIRVVSVLALPQTAVDLRHRFLLWNSWVERLADIAGPDVRAEFLSTVAMTQRLVHKTAPAIKPFGLEPLWLALCEQAGSQYPNSYLSIGLLGLRLLPERDDMPSDRPWITGLARWAAAQKPELEEFSRQWRALRALYPQAPGHWREALAETFQQKPVESMPAALQDFWKQEVDFGKRTTQTSAKTLRAPSLLLPPRSMLTSILDRAGGPFENLASEVTNLIAKYERFAEATGDNYFIVTSACNIGMRLIEVQDGDDPAGRGKLAVELARKAIAWQPTNVFAWALWRDGLAAQGQYDAAEAIGWEAIRRFPEDEQWRTQLALLLSKFPDRQHEAESLLRETIDRFPDDDVARSQLALLLAKVPDRRNEAEKLLRETVDRFPDRLVARSQLAELLIALDRPDEAKTLVDQTLAAGLIDGVLFDLKARLIYHAQGADAARQVLDEGLRYFFSNPSLKRHHELLAGGRGLSLHSAALRPATQPPFSRVKPGQADTDDVSEATRRGGRLRRLAAELPRKADDDQWRSKAVEEVRQVLAEDPNLAYAHYLQAELGDQQTQGSLSVPGVFIIAFVEAMKRKDSDRLNALESIHPGRSQLFDVARSFLFEDKAAADRAVSWLNERADVEPRPLAALRGFCERRFGTKVRENDYRLDIADGATFIKLIAANDNVRGDLIESALVPAELALAA
jgi:tetratricopeptide (TPR) repeat protein